MATLRSKSLPTHDVVGRHAAISDLRSRKVMNVVCQQNSVFASSNRKSDTDENNSRHEAVVSMLQTSSKKAQSQWWSPLFDLPAEDWSNVLHENENIKSTRHLVTPPALKQEQTPVGSEAKTLQELTVGCCHEERPRTAQRFNRQHVKFTDEKARLLRKQTRATETWHDAWYHSGIASRLAEPDQ